MFFDWFVLGGIGFWVLFGIFSLIFFFAVEGDEHFGRTLTSLFVLFGLLIIGGNLLSVIAASPWRLLWMPGWVAIGLTWSFPRWIIFLRVARRRYLEALQQYVNQVADLAPLPANWTKGQREKWVDHWLFRNVQRDFRLDFDVETGKVVPPIFKENRERMVAWVLLWPWSMFWTFCRDGLVRLTDWAIEKMGKVYQAIAANIFKDV